MNGTTKSTVSQRARAGQQKHCTKQAAVGFEPTQLALVGLESTPLGHPGELSLSCSRRHRVSFNKESKKVNDQGWQETRILLQ